MSAHSQFPRPPAWRRTLRTALLALLLPPALGAGAYRAGVIDTAPRERRAGDAASSAKTAPTLSGVASAPNIRSTTRVDGTRGSPCEVGDFAIGPCDFALDVRVGEFKTVVFDASNNSFSDVPFHVWCEADVGVSCRLINPPPGNVYVLPAGTGATSIPVELNVSGLQGTSVARLHLRRDVPGDPLELVTAVTVTPLPAQQYSVDVRASDSPREVASSVPDYFEFEVRNASSVAVDYTLATTCEGFLGACPAPSQQTLRLSPSEFGYVNVPYTTATPGGTRRVTLTATGFADGRTLTDSDVAVSNSVSYGVRVEPAAASYTADPNTDGHLRSFTVTYEGSAPSSRHELTPGCDEPAYDCRLVGSAGSVVVLTPAQRSVVPAPQVEFKVRSGYGLPAGAVTLRAEAIHDGAVFADTGRYAVTVRTHTPTVTPLGVLPRTPTPGQSLSQSFQVRNDGTGTATYRFVASCSGNGVSCAPTTFANATVAPGAANAITLSVPYTAGASGTTGYVHFAATSVTAEEYTQAATAQVVVQTVVQYGATVSAPGGTLTVARGATLTIPFTLQNQYQPNAYTLSASCNSQLYCGAVSPTSVSLVTGPVSTTVNVTVTGAAGVGAAPGTVTLTATSPNTTPQSATANVSVTGSTPQGSVAVTPDTGRVLANVTSTPGRDSMPFDVRNAATGGGAVQYTLTVPTCRGAAQGCDVSPTGLLPDGKLEVAPSVTKTVFVRFTPVSATGDSGRIILRAAGAGVSDTGTRKVVAERLVEVTDVNPGAAVVRDQCVTGAVGPAAAYACGDLALAHALPSVTTRGTTRTPALMYNSQHAHNIALVRANVALRKGVTQAESVSVTLQIGGVTRDTRRYAPAGWNAVVGGSPAGTARRVALGFNASSLTTGVYPYAITVQYAGGVAVVARDTLVVVNRAASPFGAGWWLAGYERLYPAGEPLQPAQGARPPSQVLWVGDDGSARVYRRVDDDPNSAVYAARAMTHPDTLTWARTGPTIGVAEWSRLLPGGGSVRFDPAGLHWRTVDRLGQSTWFDHTGNYDHPSLIRPPASDVGWALEYAPVGGTRRLRRVAQVRAVGVPLVTGQAMDTLRVVRVANTAGTVDTLVDPDGARVRFGHASGVVTSRTDRRGTTQYFAYDDYSYRLRQASATVSTAGGPQTITHALCAVEGQGLSACRTGPADPVSLATSWNGPRTDVTDVSYFSVDRWGMPTRVQDPLGQVTTIGRTHGTYAALVTSVLDPRQLETITAYNGRGLPTTVTVDDPLGDGRDAITSYTYDAACPYDVATMTPPSGVMTRYTYYPGLCAVYTAQVGPDAARRVTYDVYTTGELAGLPYQTQVADVPSPSYTVYDGLGNVTSTRSPGGLVSTVDRDVLGRDTLVAQPTSASVTRAARVLYDKMDRDTLSWNAVPGDTLFVRTLYDAEGAPAKLSRWARTNGQLTAPLIDTTSYDGAGRPARQDDSFRPGVAPTMSYDPAGNLLRATNRRGQPVVMTYDPLGRVLSRVADGQTATFAYDSAGRWQTAANAAGRDSLRFGRAGQLASHDTFRGAGGVVHSRVRWAYDSAGRVRLRSVVAGGDSSAARYHYDSLGRLDTLVDVSGRKTAVAYAPGGAPDRVTYGNGVRADYTVPWPGVPSELRYTGPTGAALGFGGRYSVDARFGRVEDQLDRRAAEGGEARRDFTFDALGRLARAEDLVLDPCTPYYDGGGGVAVDNAPPGQEGSPMGHTCPPPRPAGRLYEYAFDRFGDRLRDTHRPGHRLQAATVGGVTRTFEHDADGNTTRKVASSASQFDQVLTWDALGQLTQVATTKGGGATQTVRYAYDAFGRRAARTAPDHSVEYTLWDGDDVAATLNAGGTPTAVYTFWPGVDRPHSVRAGTAGAAVRYFAMDVFGSVVGLTDVAGAAVARYAVGPFGEAEPLGADSGVVANRLRFKARELDPSTGLYDMRARWYDPEVGRFVSEDPLGLAGGVNPYAFAGNDPVNYADPYGLRCRRHWGWRAVYDGDRLVDYQILYDFVECDPDPNDSGGGGSGGPAAPPPKLHCPQRSDFARSQLRGVRLETNIRRGYSLREKNAFARLWAFYRLMQDGGDFDVKLRGGVKSPDLQYGGNWHFGVVGRAAGYSEGFLAWGAGVNQWTKELGKSVKHGMGSPFPSRVTNVPTWPFGDDPRDQLAIMDGFIYANACGIR